MSAKENAATVSPVTVVGKLPTLSKTNLNRISAFLVQDQTLVTEAPVSVGGTFQFRLLPPIVFNPCWIVILGPRGLDVQTLLSRTELPRLSLASAASNLANTREAKGGTITLDFTKLDVSDKIIDLWWIWCRTYTISGVLQSTNGCPVPGAEVTVYNVRTGIIGPVKSPIETVTTDARRESSPPRSTGVSACVAGLAGPSGGTAGRGGGNATSSLCSRPSSVRCHFPVRRSAASWPQAPHL